MRKSFSYSAIYFLGIGGIGMSALARYFQSLGYTVAGYDKTPSPLTRELEESGIEIVYREEVEALPAAIRDLDPDKVLWVYTPAVPAAMKQLAWLEEQGIMPVKRARLLGMVTQGRYALAVAGTHGKTTTSALLAHLLRAAGKDCTAFLGGISVNYNTNYLEANNVEEAPVVVEADEFDRSFLQLRPNCAIVTSVDADHLDIYGGAESFRQGFEDFVTLLPEEGLLLQRKGLNLVTGATQYTYAAGEEADYSALNIRIEGGAYLWDLKTPDGTLHDLRLGLPGRHNMENAVAASALALYRGVKEEELRAGLASFLGVKRRFEKIVERPGCVYIDDYAHHPRELSACIGSIRELYPGKRITGIFQPHLYSRTRDFMDDFARSLSLLDVCVLMEIYPARELPVEGVTSSALLKKITCAEKELMSAEAIPRWVRGQQPELLLTLGAGDIDRLVPQLREVLV